MEGGGRLTGSAWVWDIPSIYGEEKKIAANIRQIMEKWQEEEHLLNDVMTAVTEACLNAMEHGNNMLENKMVQVVFQICGSDYHIRVYDEGSGFNINLTSMSRNHTVCRDGIHACTTVDETSCRGWGLYFIRSFSRTLQSGWEGGRFFIEFRMNRTPGMQVEYCKGD